MVKNLHANTGHIGSIPGSGRSPEEEMATHSVIFLPGESHGQRSLAGYRPWGHKTVRHDLTIKQRQQCFLIRTYYLLSLLIFVLAVLHCIWDPSSLMRNQTYIPCTESL